MRIDLNCDAVDIACITGSALLDVVTAANVPCDWEPRRMREACEAAVKRDVAIGALVGYRREPCADPDELIDDVLYQLGALDALAGSAGGEVRYVKPLMRDEHAVAVAEALWQYDPLMPVLCPPGSRLFAEARETGLITVAEAFPGRQYHPAGHPLDTVLTDPDEIAWRCLRLVTQGEVIAVDGTAIPLRADSLFVSGHTSVAVHTALRSAGVELRSFA